MEGVGVLRSMVVNTARIFVILLNLMDHETNFQGVDEVGFGGGWRLIECWLITKAVVVFVAEEESGDVVVGFGRGLDVFLVGNRGV